MVKNLKKEAREKIEEFFSRQDFSSDEVKKIKRLAMKYNIKLGEKRKKFCKECCSRLKGKTRVEGSHKSVVCDTCGRLNRFKL